MTHASTLRRTESDAVPANEAEPSRFGRWLKTVPVLLAILAAAANAVAGRLLPQSAIPQPLNVLRDLGVVIGMAALLLTWIFRAGLRKHVRYVFGATALMLVLLMALYTARVKQVRYWTTEENDVRVETVSFITGWKVTDPTLKDFTAEDLIRKAGDGWEELHAVWGISFDAVAYTYIGLYVLVMIGIVLTVSGIDLEQPKRDTSRKSAARPQKGKRSRLRV